MFARKAKLITPVKEVEKKLETNLRIVSPSQASAIDVTPGRNQQWWGGKQSSP